MDTSYLRDATRKNAKQAPRAVQRLVARRRVPPRLGGQAPGVLAGPAKRSLRRPRPRLALGMLIYSLVDLWRDVGGLDALRTDPVGGADSQRLRRRRARRRRPRAELW